MQPEIITKYTIEYKFLFWDFISRHPAIAVTITLAVTISIVWKIVVFFRRKRKDDHNSG